MRGPSFSLHPFSRAGLLPGLQVMGSIARQSGILTIHYDLVDPQRDVAIPHRAALPGRRKGLWEETCFELFFAHKDSHRYWEFNVSPAGHWNIYRFEAYRLDMQEETAFASIPFRVRVRGNALRIVVELDLTPVIPESKTVELALSAVLKHGNGVKTYWALTHCGSQPDFHRRDSFVVEM